MNQRKAKLLRRLSVLMAKEDSMLGRSYSGNRYPAESARAIYQRLKRLSHNPDTYRMFKLTYLLSRTGIHAGRAAHSIRDLTRQLNITQRKVGGLRKVFS